MRGFGITYDTATGACRNWYIGGDGAKRWADNDELVSGVNGQHDGERISPPAQSEADHYYTCPHCGQAVDMRILAQVIHHERDGHGRMGRES